MSQSDREYITALHDRALRNRLVDPSDRDTDIGVAFIGLVEEYYVLPRSISDKFRNMNKSFAEVFLPDLPAYNGAYGKVEAIINVPDNLPSSDRLKQVPWYPKKLLGELQDHCDILEKNGAIKRPLDLIPPVNVEAMSHSFLVAKKPASRGY